jgi:hypothetical protein
MTFTFIALFSLVLSMNNVFSVPVQTAEPADQPYTCNRGTDTNIAERWSSNDQPSRNRAISLRQEGGSWYGKISVAGDTEYEVIMDTGSSDLWVSSDQVVSLSYLSHVSSSIVNGCHAIVSRPSKGYTIGRNSRYWLRRWFWSSRQCLSHKRDYWRSRLREHAGYATSRTDKDGRDQGNRWPGVPEFDSGQLHQQPEFREPVSYGLLDG